MNHAKIRLDFADTSTRPTPGMRRAMAQAEVGDEQRGEDPTVNALNERVADLLGHEAAMFLPSGTMCNQVAVSTHCRAGDEVIAAANAHIIGVEGAGAAVFAGSFVRGIETPTGIFTATDVATALRIPDIKVPRSRLVAVEQTNNFGGGSIWPREALAAIAQVARDNGLAVHMDGARLLNAVVASGVSARDYAALCDSAWLDLSKGLGCPIGGVLAGSRAFIEAAMVWKYRLGGAMRQAGIIAAAGIYALDHHVDRLAEDHDNARHLAGRLGQIPGITVEPVATNLVFFDVAGSDQSAPQLAERLVEQGVRMNPFGATRMRAGVHLDIDRPGIDEAADLVATLVA